MKKFKILMLVLILVFCGPLIFSACDKKKKSEGKPMAPVESVITPLLTNGNTYTINTVLGSVPICSSVGDTSGELVWKNPTLQILVGENEYEWVFTPEDSQKYKPATGFLKIKGVEEYQLSIQIGTLSSQDNEYIWTYGEVVGEPQLLGYTGPTHLISVEWEYYDKNNQLLLKMPTEVGEYKIKAVVSIEGRNDIVSPFVDVKIVAKEVTTFNLDIDDWTFGKTPNLPKIDNEYADKVAYYYSSVIDSGFVEMDINDYSTFPRNAGTYYLKALFVDKNYVGESSVIEFKIIPANFSGTINDILPATFNSLSQKPNVIIAGLNEDDYTLSWEYKTHEDLDDKFKLLDTHENNFVKAGVYRVTATLKGNYTGKLFADYFISKAVFTNKTHSDITNILLLENLTVANIPLDNGWAWDTTDNNYNKFLTEGENIRIAIYSEENYEPFKFNVKIIVVPNPNVTTEQEFINAVAKDNLTNVNINENIVLTKNLTIDKTKRILILAGKTLTVENGVSLNIYENVEIQGNFVNLGNLTIYTSDLLDLSLNPNKIVLMDNLENKTISYNLNKLNLEIDLNSKTLTNVNFIIDHNIASEDEFNILIKNGVINSNSNCIHINGQDKTIVRLENLNISSENCALFVQGSNQLSLVAENCELTGNNGLYLQAGNIELTNCSVIGTGVIVETPIDLSVTGYAIFINANTDVLLIINGGSLTTVNDSSVIREYQTEPVDVIIEIIVEVDNVTFENIYCNREDVVVAVSED